MRSSRNSSNARNQTSCACRNSKLRSSNYRSGCVSWKATGVTGTAVRATPALGFMCARTLFPRRRNFNTRNSITNIASSSPSCRHSRSRRFTCPTAAKISPRRCDFSLRSSCSLLITPHPGVRWCSAAISTSREPTWTYTLRNGSPASLDSGPTRGRSSSALSATVSSTCIARSSQTTRRFSRGGRRGERCGSAISAGVSTWCSPAMHLRIRPPRVPCSASSARAITDPLWLSSKFHEARPIVEVLLHNVRSLYNVGAFFRTADAVGLSRLYLSGFTGAPPSKEIAKTALGSEQTVPWERANPSALIDARRAAGWETAAVETVDEAVDLFDWQPKFPVLIVFGHEVVGLPAELVQRCDTRVRIPMVGTKRSLNVATAGGVVMYELFRKMRARGKSYGAGPLS